MNEMARTNRPVSNLRRRAARAKAGVIRTFRSPERSLAFVIVGTGRSGTGFTSSALTDIGIPVGHERCFRPEGSRFVPGMVGDCSWMAVPRLDRIRGRVLHQVRHPLNVIDSLIDIGLFAPDPTGADKPYRDYLEKHFELGDDELVNATRFYVEWNRRCEAFASARYRLEDELDVLVDSIVDLVPADRSSLLSALQAAPTANSREARGMERTRPGGLILEDLPERERDLLLAMADDYGYRFDG